MEKKYIFTLLTAIWLFININIYFGDNLILPHEDCNSLTNFGALYMYYAHFCTLVLIPFGYHFLFNSDSDEYYYDNTTSYAIALICLIFIGIPLFIVLMVPDLLFNDNCPKPIATSYGEWFLAFYGISYAIGSIFGILEFIYRILIWMKKILPTQTKIDQWPS